MPVSLHTSASERPSRPWTWCMAGLSVTWNPVPKMIVSTSCSVPSAVTIDRSRTSTMPSVTTWTLGCDRAGYQSFDSSSRLQPGR